jgi:hypothetical protein
MILAGQSSWQWKRAHDEDGGHPYPFATTPAPSSSTRKRISSIENPFDHYAAVILESFPEINPIYKEHVKAQGFS